MVDLLIKKLLPVLFLSIFTLSCTNNQKEKGVNSHKVESDTIVENKTIIREETTKFSQNETKDTLPSWLRQRFPDSVNIDYSYGFITNEISVFKKLNHEYQLVITRWSDGLCSVDSAFTFQSKAQVSSAEIGRGCDNPHPNLNYEHTNYKLISNNVIQSTTYSETLPDSIYEIAVDNPTYNTSEFKKYAETTNEYYINEDGHILKK